MDIAESGAPDRSDHRKVDRSSPNNPPRLHRELLFNLGLLTAAAISVAVISALVAQVVAPKLAAAVLIALIAADLAIVFVFGKYLVNRLVLRPLKDLNRATLDVSSGDLGVRVPTAETQEFADLANRFNEMTTRLRIQQDQLLKAEKLAGIGQLAAGVAHEIGNPLAAVGNYVALLERRAGGKDTLEEIKSELDRMDRILRDLLEYARSKSDAREPVDIASLVRSVVQRLERQGTLNSVSLDMNCPQRGPTVDCQPHQMEQAVVNLLINAAEAAEGGSVKIDLEESVSDSFQVRSPAKGILLSVADSGPGIPEADRGRVFDPFFTTKAPGSGTGLGLAIVHRAVDEQGGRVWVEKSSLGGAVFKVFLPQAE